MNKSVRSGPGGLPDVTKVTDANTRVAVLGITSVLGHLERLGGIGDDDVDHKEFALNP
jgi:hypothetical protein